MVKYAIVGLAGALVGGLATWALVPAAEVEDRPAQAPSRARRETREVTRQEPADDRAFAECKRALFQQRAELRIVREEAARAADERGRIPIDDDEVAIGDGPSGRGTSSETQQGGPTDAQTERERRQANNERVRDAVVERLGITEDEQRVVKDIVCSQRDNLRGLYDDFAEGRLDADAFFAALAQERATSGEGLQRALGKGRYKRLRRVGAISLLTPRLCDRR